MSSNAFAGPFVSTSEDVTPNDIFEGRAAGAYRGLLFAMLFNLLLIVCGAVVWLMVGKL